MNNNVLAFQSNKISLISGNCKHVHICWFNDIKRPRKCFKTSIFCFEVRRLIHEATPSTPYSPIWHQTDVASQQQTSKLWTYPNEESKWYFTSTKRLCPSILRCWIRHNISQAFQSSIIKVEQKCPSFSKQQDQCLISGNCKHVQISWANKIKRPYLTS